VFSILRRALPDSHELPFLLPLSELLTVGGFLLALVLSAQVLRARRPVATTISWLLVIVLLPWVGVPLYLTFGGRKVRRLAGKKAKVYGATEPGAEGPIGGAVERVLRSFGVPPATAGNRVRLVTDGQDAYRHLLRIIDGAELTLHVTTYVLGRDAVGAAIVARLTARAAAGVEVRLLIDDLGSWRLKRSSLQPLTAAGGQVAFFMPVFHLPFRGRNNLRNHRKSVVADGRTALAGGMNLAAEYMGPDADPARWRDVALVVEGPAAADLDDLFHSDWQFARGEDQAEPAVSPSTTATPGRSAGEGDRGETPVQVVASGPDTEGDPLYESLISLLFAAERRVWVVTPYFVPDEIMGRGLELAARRGVDVRLVVPYRSNHVTADLARVAYLRDLNDAGGRILRYRPTMIHAKALLIDDDLAVVGSANMDMRSLFLNYEVSLYLYSRPQADDLDRWFRSLFPRCQPGLGRQTRLVELGESVARLLSPLL